MQLHRKRVYGICIDELDKNTSRKIKKGSLGNYDFKELAEKQGLVWTLTGFEQQFNNNEITTYNIYIRFLDEIVEV